MRLEGSYHSPLAREAEAGIRNAECKVLPLHDREVTKKLFKPNIFKRSWVDSSEYGPAFVSGNNIYRMNPAPDRYVSKDSTDIKSYLLKEGMVVFQAAGQLNGLFGWPVLVNSYLEGMFCSDDVFRIVPPSKTDAGFIYAYLRTNYAQRLLKRQAYGYSIPRVVAEHVGQVLIPWPDEQVRHRIGNSVVRAWDEFAKAITVESNAISLVEHAIHEESVKLHTP
jgi:type I restriction enzyme S subunit